MKKNIVVVVSAMNLGGAQRVASILCEHWAQNGYVVTLISTFSGKKTNFRPSPIASIVLISYSSLLIL